MPPIVLHLLAQFFFRFCSLLEQLFLHLTQPYRHSIALAAAADLMRSKADLIVENAILRQQLIVLHRQVKSAPFRKRIVSASFFSVTA